MGWHDTSSQLSSCDTATLSWKVCGLAWHIVMVVFMWDSHFIMVGLWAGTKHHHGCLYKVVLIHSQWAGQVSSSSQWTSYSSMIRHCGSMTVHFDCLSTDVSAGAAGVSLAGWGEVGCFARVAGAKEGFSGNTDGLSEVVGVVLAIVTVLVSSTVVGVCGSNS